MHLCLYDAFRYDANHTTSFDLKRSRFSETLQFVESVVLKEALEPLGGMMPTARPSSAFGFKVASGSMVLGLLSQAADKQLY